MLTLGISGCYLPPAAGAKLGSFTLLDAICLTGETATVRRYYFLVFFACPMPIRRSMYDDMQSANMNTTTEVLDTLAALRSESFTLSPNVGGWFVPYKERLAFLKRDIRTAVAAARLGVSERELALALADTRGTEEQIVFACGPIREEFESLDESIEWVVQQDAKASCEEEEEGD